MYIVSYHDRGMAPHWIDSVKNVSVVGLEMTGSPFRSTAVQVTYEEALEMKQKLYKWSWPEVHIMPVSFFIGQNICLR